MNLRPTAMTIYAKIKVVLIAPGLSNIYFIDEISTCFEHTKSEVIKSTFWSNLK